MNKIITTLTLVVLTSLSSFADSSSASVNDNSDWTLERGWSALGDVLLVRPLGVAATVGGFGLFAVSSPFAAMADSTEEVFNTLVKAPADYTFDRDLGVWSK